MTSPGPSVLLTALGLLCHAGGASADVDTSEWKCTSCPYPKGASGTLEAGAGTVSDDAAKFGDMTGLQRKGAYAVLGGSLRLRGDGTYADVHAADLGLASRSLDATGGQEGLVALKLGYAELPRHFEAGATPFIGSGGAVQTLPAGYPASSTAAMPLAATLQPAALGYERKRFDLGGSLVAFENWTYRVKFTHETRDGTLPVYGAFFTTSSQLAAPVDQTTDQFEVSASYARHGLQASLGYLVSRFRNGDPSLTWDNPFNPVVAGSTRGQLALAPANELHQVTGSAGYDITPALRASADFAYGRLTQNQAYLAPTLNAALAAAVPALPAQSLDGRVDTFDGKVRLAATLRPDLRVVASYARDVRDNKTAVLAYPLIATDMFVEAGTRKNTPFGLTEDRWRLNADYRGVAAVKLSAGADLDYRERPYSEVVKTRETTFWGRAGLQPRDNLALSFKIAHAERSNSTYGTAVWFGAPDNPLLRKYNLAARRRDAVGARADLTFGDGVSAGFALDAANDDYTNSTVGLTGARSVDLAADLSAALSEDTHVTAYAQLERIRSQQAGSEAGAAADWTALDRDQVDVIGLGIRHTLIADRCTLAADLVHSRSRSQLSLTTVSGAPPFPANRTAQDSLKLSANYKVRDDLWLNATLRAEHYSSQDWRLDGVLPATVQNLLSLGQSSPHYQVEVLSVALRYRF